MKGARLILLHISGAPLISSNEAAAGEYLPSGMSGKQVQMYCAIQTKRRSSLGPDPKDVIAGPEVVPLPSLVLANVFRVMLLIN